MTTPQEARELAEHYADTTLVKPALRSLAAQVEALTAELAKVEQGEPAGWFIDVTTNGESTGDWQVAAREHWGDLSICKPLFTHPVRPMSAEQIREMLESLYTSPKAAELAFDLDIPTIRAAEAFHGIKGATE